MSMRSVPMMWLRLSCTVHPGRAVGVFHLSRRDRRQRSDRGPLGLEQVDDRIAHGVLPVAGCRCGTPSASTGGHGSVRTWTPRCRRGLLRPDVPVRLSDVALDPLGPRADRPGAPLAVLLPGGGQPRGGQEAPVGTGLVLRVEADAHRRPAPAPSQDDVDRWYEAVGGPSTSRAHDPRSDDHRELLRRARVRSRPRRRGHRRPHHLRRGPRRSRFRHRHLGGFGVPHPLPRRPRRDPTGVFGPVVVPAPTGRRRGPPVGPVPRLRLVPAPLRAAPPRPATTCAIIAMAFEPYLGRGTGTPSRTRRPDRRAPRVSASATRNVSDVGGEGRRRGRARCRRAAYCG